MSKSTFKILFYIRKNQVTKEGKSSIMVRLTVNGETSQFSSKLEIEPDLWDVSKQRMAGNTVKARHFNSTLEDIRVSLINHYREIELHESFVTAEKVRNAFLGITTRQQTLLATFSDFNEDVKKLVGISKPTKDGYSRPSSTLEDTASHLEEIRRQVTERTTASRSEQSEAQFLFEGDSRPLWYH